MKPDLIESALAMNLCNTTRRKLCYVAQRLNVASTRKTHKETSCFRAGDYHTGYLEANLARIVSGIID